MHPRLKPIFLLVFLGFSLWAPPLCHAETIIESPQIMPGGDLLLVDGRILHLQGISLSRDQNENPEAQAFLENLVKDKQLEIETGVIDRYGRVCAPVSAVDAAGEKIWLQGAMLDAGMAFVYPPMGDEPYLDDMLRREREARQAKRGMWAEAAYADTPADKVDRQYGQYAFVSGVIVKAERVKNKVYLNFGADWRTDFTIAIAAHDLHFFKEADIDPLTYQSKNVRVRGWVKRDFGPMITVTHPSQIEIISANAGNAVSP